MKKVVKRGSSLRHGFVSRGFILILLACMLAGCAHWTEFQERPASGVVGGVDRGNAPASTVAAIDSVTVLSNGVNVPPSLDFVHRLAAALRATGAFSAVHDPSNAHLAGEGSIRIRFHVDQEVDENKSGNFMRGFCIGLTFFMLAPIVLLKISMQSRMQSDVLGFAGGARQYQATSRATEYTKYFANKVQAGYELGLAVTDSSLNSIAAQIAADIERRQ